MIYLFENGQFIYFLNLEGQKGIQIRPFTDQPQWVVNMLQQNTVTILGESTNRSYENTTPR